MKLFHSPASPFVRKVAVVLHETGLSGIEMIAASGGVVDPGSMPVDMNPLGKIPTLITDSGEILYDSRVICRYLDDLSGGTLYPPAPRLWQVLTLEAAADGMLDAALLMVYEARFRPEALRFAPWVEGQWAKITRSLDMLEREAMDHLYGPPDMAHIAVGCALGYLDFRLSNRAWRAERPDLAAWEAAYSARPAMLATAPVA